MHKRDNEKEILNDVRITQNEHNMVVVEMKIVDAILLLDVEMEHQRYPIRISKRCFSVNGTYITIKLTRYQIEYFRR